MTHTRTFSVAMGSLTAGAEALLVNASNTNAELGTGVSGAIRAACGPGYQRMLTDTLQARFGGALEPGQVFITDAGTHPTARYVAHVAVMDYREGFTGSSYPSLELIETCYRNLWDALEALPDERVSVALVALGAGTGNVGLNNSVRAACQTFARHTAHRTRSKIGDVVFYGFQLHEYIATLAVVRRHFDVDLDAVDPEIRQALASWSVEQA